MMNDFFDCTNVRSLQEHERKRNDLIKPYTGVDDDRFGWLLDVFLKYLENWKKSDQLLKGMVHIQLMIEGKSFFPLQTMKVFRFLFTRMLRLFNSYFSKDFSTF